MPLPTPANDLCAHGPYTAADVTPPPGAQRYEHRGASLWVYPTMGSYGWCVELDGARWGSWECISGTERGEAVEEARASVDRALARREVPAAVVAIVMAAEMMGRR